MHYSQYLLAVDLHFYNVIYVIHIISITFPIIVIFFLHLYDGDLRRKVVIRLQVLLLFGKRGGCMTLLELRTS